MKKIVSLFSGCGGLDLGFHQEGFSMEYACDNFSPAVSTYRRNIDKNCFLIDVTSEGFRRDLKSISSCDVVLGGLPCQGFSKAGPKRELDSRNTLYVEMLEAVKTLMPDVFIAENVDGLSQNFGGKILENITADFSELGYKVEYKIIDMAWFGVPQHRRRIIFIGRRDEGREFIWPNPTHQVVVRNGDFSLKTFKNDFDGKKLVSIKDAIHDLIDLDNSIPDHKITNNWPDQYNEIMQHIGEGKKLCNVRFSPTSVYTWDIPSVFGTVSEKEVKILETIGMNRRHKKYGAIPNGNPLPKEVIAELSSLKSIKNELDNLISLGYLKTKNGGYDLKGAMFCSGIFKKPRWNEPSQTVLTNFYNPRYFIHPKAPRPFSLRECARLQSFPDSFVFESDEVSLVDGYKLVGNAVPPLFSSFLAKAVKNYFSEKLPKRAKRSNHNEIATTI